MKDCPVCTKPLLFSLYAPKDTAKMACSDLNCVNAHGIIQTLPFDFLPEPEVHYGHTSQPQRKGNTMTTELITVGDLYYAQVLVRNLNHAQERLQNHLGPYLGKYKELLLELNPSYDSRDLLADTFLETDREFFSFTGEETYVHGDYYIPSLNLPFAFVEDPEAYITKTRQEEADRKAKATARTAKDKAERVERLKIQLAKAQAELDKAEQGNDPIKLTATRNHVESLSR